MELINHTPYPTGLFRTIIDENRFAAAIITRVTYDLKDEVTALPSSKQLWPVKMQPWVSEFGPMQSDAVFYRDGVDLFVFGNARTPDAEPMKQMELKIFYENNFIHSIRIYGNRIWEKTTLGINISEPESFTSIPITLENAFGGIDDWDELKLPYGNNPLGKGFIWKKENIVGKVLPNIEDPQKLIKKWNDMPDPVGTAYCPMNELHIRGNIDYEADGEITKIYPRLFNAAFPMMILNTVKIGDKISIEGFTEKLPFHFIIPQHDLKFKLILGDKIIHEKLCIDQIGLVPDLNQAFITYRYPFRYFFKAMQKRYCEVLEN